MNTGENSSSSNSSPTSKDNPPASKDDDEKMNGRNSNVNSKGIVVYGQELTSQLCVVEVNDSKKLENMIYEGLVFKSEKEAYEHYYLYAHQVGFSVRKDKKYFRQDGSVRSRYFVCFKEGQRRKDRRYTYVRKGSKERKEHKETRTGCKARMAVKNRGNEWIVSEITHEHNHPLGAPSTITMDDKDRKIRELVEQLQHEKRLRRACEKRINQILEDVEEHTKNLSSKVEVVVNNVKKLDSEEEAIEIVDDTDRVLLHTPVHLSGSKIGMSN